MSEAKKWVKHTPSETPKAKRKLPAKAAKQKKPPIPQDTLEALRRRYSVPISVAANDIDESYQEIWDLTCDLKGYLTKAAFNKNTLGMHKVFWPRLREILDQAIAKNDPTAFEQFAKAWVTAEIRNTARQKSVNTGKPVTAPEASLAESIENLIPNLPTNNPNSRKSIEILNIIERLQGGKKKGLKRAPTQAEIAAASKGDGITQGEVSRQIKKMGLGSSLSVS